MNNLHQSFGFDNPMATPANPKALEYAQAIFEMLQARQNLNEAKNSVPNYTGQFTCEDYYQNEQEKYNRACDRLYEVSQQ